MHDDDDIKRREAECQELLRRIDDAQARYPEFRNVLRDAVFKELRKSVAEIGAEFPKNYAFTQRPIGDYDLADLDRLKIYNVLLLVTAFNGLIPRAPAERKPAGAIAAKLESLRATVRAGIDDLMKHAEREHEFLLKDVELMNAQQELPKLRDLATLFVVAAMLGEI